MKEVLFLLPADRELADAIQYYNDQLEGLGDRFFKDTMEAIDLIQAFPLSWAKIGKHTHRMILKRFPYLILYIPENEKLIITAIAHQHRKPEYYIDRARY